MLYFAAVLGGFALGGFALGGFALGGFAPKVAAGRVRSVSKVRCLR